MKSLFFHIGAPSPILETEIELIKLSLEKKENVTLVRCISDIETCFFNRSHRKSFCKKCISKLDNGLEITGVKNDINLLDLKLSKLNLKYKVPKFKSIDQIKNFKFEKIPIGFGISSSLLSHELEHRPNLNKFKYDLDFIEDIKKKTLSSIKIYLYFKKLLKKNKPDKVYLFNGRISDTWPIMCLCKKYKINYYIYETGAKNMYRVIKNSTPHLIQTQIKPEKKFLKYNVTKKILLAKRYIYDKKNLFKEYSMTNFSAFQKKDLIPLMNKNLRNISIFPSRLDEFESIKGLKKKIYKPDDTAAIFKILNHFQKFKEYFFFIKLHPGMRMISINSTQMLDFRKISKIYKNAKVIWPESNIDSYALIKKSEKIITFGSTIDNEACFLKKPVISLNNNLFTQLNCVYAPKNHAEALKLISKKKLKSKNWKNSLFFFYYYLNRGKNFKFFKKESNKITYNNIKIKANIFLVLIDFLFSIFYKIKNIKLSLIFDKIINLKTIKLIFYYK